ncbi:lasso peptide biosynthesis protein [Nonomuraea typhae]|uniref:lasso peptide biosynthesis protein n=1 Tax=Nonomuraea typhae TaxID=2603600 RepID=UPI0012F987F0|nr:lasso peptide biosynthesis protein [Nonomuraea typhae]
MSRALDWEFFLADPATAPHPPRLPPRLRAYAVARTARALLVYRRHGWTTAQRDLQQVRPGPGAAAIGALPADAAIRLARRSVFPAQLILRVIHPDGLCLPRSFTLATYLSALGLPAEMTIARALSTAVPKNSFHSWTELYGTVLNDNPDVQVGYRVLQRISAQPPANRV